MRERQGPIQRLFRDLPQPLVILVVLLTSDRKVMGERVNSRSAQMLGWSCVAVICAVAVALLAI